jgi:hypothetical protein
MITHIIDIDNLTIPEGCGYVGKCDEFLLHITLYPPIEVMVSRSITLGLTVTIAHEGEISAIVVPPDGTLFGSKGKGKDCLNECCTVELAKIDDEFLCGAYLKGVSHIWHTFKQMGEIEHEVGGLVGLCLTKQTDNLHRVGLQIEDFLSLSSQGREKQYSD